MRTATLVSLALIMAASGSSAQAPRMPAEFVGVWAHQGASCDLPVGPSEGEFPFLVVTPDGYGEHEGTCRLRTASPASPSGDGTIRTMTFTCEGEGMTWPVAERWSSETARAQLGEWDLSQPLLIRDGQVFRRCGLLAGADRRRPQCRETVENRKGHCSSFRC